MALQITRAKKLRRWSRLAHALLVSAGSGQSRVAE
jgi:hypothetical protein